MSKLVFGCGYLGKRVAAQWRQAGHSVHVITRSSERAVELQTEGFHPIVADVCQPDTLTGLPEAETILYAVGFDRNSNHSIEEVYVDGFENVLAAISRRTQRLIYVSSTGVYGYDDGCWIDETSRCNPTRAGGLACLAAEQRLQQHPLAECSIILRMAGIYGPNRIPRRQDIARGIPLNVASAGYLNLIHVEDAVQVILRAEAASATPELYLVSDGQPVLRRDYFCELARLLGLEKPSFESSPANSSREARASGSKRIKNNRMLEKLEISLRFPSYREGLADGIIG